MKRIFIFFLPLFFTACSSDEKQLTYEELIIGEWKLIKECLVDNDVEAYCNYYSDYNYVFKSDGYCYHYRKGEYIHRTSYYFVDNILYCNLLYAVDGNAKKIINKITKTEIVLLENYYEREVVIYFVRVK